MSASPPPPQASPAAGPEAPAAPSSRGRRREAAVACGLLLITLAAYLLTGAGRLDSIDGQVRYEVAYNWLVHGVPAVRDPAVAGWAGVPGRHGELYAGYGQGASVSGMPLVWLGGLVGGEGGESGEARRFLYSWTTGLFGAVLTVLLFLLYRLLGVGRRSAAAWTAVTAFATLLWPGAATVLPQVQHAALALAALLLAHAAARRGSGPLAALAGAVGGLMIAYQEPYLLILPVLGVAALRPAAAAEPRRRAWSRYALFLAACGLGVALSLHFNLLRFGELFYSPTAESAHRHPPIVGNPVAGVAALLASPGKSVLLYSPPLLLALLGLRGLWRRERELAAAALGTGLLWLLFIGSLSIFHGDWAWGPRYLVLPVVLLGLAYPFVPRRPWRRPLVAALVAAGVAVQLLGLSLPHERFFFERNLPTYFWAGDPGFYFRESALLARPGEIARTLSEGIPETARYLTPTVDPRRPTYYIMAPPPGVPGEVWVLNFQIFHLPRPWPLWMPQARRLGYDLPVAPEPLAALLLAVGLAGAALLFWGTREPADSGPAA